MPSDRLAKLLRGLPEDVDELDDDLNRDELRRRIAAVQNGTATLIPGEHAREMVRRFWPQWPQRARDPVRART